MMRESLILVGAGGLGRVVLEIACLKYTCYFVDDGYEIGTKICGTTVIGKSSDLEALRKDYDNVVITIGDNVTRQKKYELCASLDYNFPSVVHPSAYISCFSTVGEGTILLNNSVVQNGASVGKCTILNSG